MRKRKHYFFRFGSGSEHFMRNYSLADRSDPSKGLIHRRDEPGKAAANIELAIYYSDFTLASLGHDLRGGVSGLPLSSQARSKIIEFFSASIGDVFWIFLPDAICALELTEERAYDRDDPFDGMPAKCRRARFLDAWSREEVPELLSTTDAMGYRGTLLELGGANDRAFNGLIAEAMVGEQILLSKPSSALEYLSPVQLETVLFKIFDCNGFIVAAHRGGSKAHLDLVVHPGPRNLSPFICDSYVKIQVKRTFNGSKKRRAAFLSDIFGRGIYFVTLDKRLEAIPSVAEHSLFIGPKKFSALLDSPVASAVYPWLKAVLGPRFVAKF